MVLHGIAWYCMVSEVVIWTQPSGPLCLWQHLHIVKCCTFTFLLWWKPIFWFTLTIFLTQHNLLLSCLDPHWPAGHFKSLCIENHGDFPPYDGSPPYSGPPLYGDFPPFWKQNGVIPPYDGSPPFWIPTNYTIAWFPCPFTKKVSGSCTLNFDPGDLSHS